MQESSQASSEVQKKTKKWNERRGIKRKKKRNLTKWSSEEDAELFRLNKVYKTDWPQIKLFFPDKTEIQIKNRFYSTLRRVATKYLIAKGARTTEVSRMSKHELVKFTAEAIRNGHNTYSKRGRKTKKDKDTKLKDDAYLMKETKHVERIGVQDLPVDPLLSSPSFRRENSFSTAFSSTSIPQHILQSYSYKAPVFGNFGAKHSSYPISLLPYAPTMVNGYELVVIPCFLNNGVTLFSNQIVAISQSLFWDSMKTNL